MRWYQLAALYMKFCDKREQCGIRTNSDPEKMDEGMLLRLGMRTLKKGNLTFYQRVYIQMYRLHG